MTLWTVARFPDGSWSYGGSPTCLDYKLCEVWVIEALNGKDAVKRAQRKRAGEVRKRKRKAPTSD